MTHINKINKLSLSDKNNHPLSVCNHHRTEICSLIYTSLNELISSNTNLKDLFDRQTQNCTTPYTIHFSENEIRINNESQKFENLENGNTSGKDLIEKINDIYMKCHPSPLPSIPNPSFQAATCPCSFGSSPYIQPHYYHPFQAYHHPYPQPQNCNHICQPTTCHSLSATATNNQSMPSCSLPPTEESPISSTVPTPLNISRQTSLESKISVDTERVASEIAIQTDENDHTEENTLYDLLNELIDTSVIHRTKSFESSQEWREKIAIVLAQNEEVANDVYFQMYLVACRQKSSRETSCITTDYETGKRYYTENQDSISDEDRAVALQRFVLRQLQKACNKNQPHSHNRWIETYNLLPEDVRNKIEAIMWEVCGGDQNAEIEFGKKQMTSSLDYVKKAEAIQRHLEKELIQ